ncbi:AAA domain-domain-containing protein [Clohesyomyces aquaticus]|uniref:AAA domain-domain-containing protein n=1 Tax=Clohesyomyces aquaticus TaxID=1231657 RepID=A0A1Y1ZCM9_9PLEO|nr:AAA domain-domain-containing protein [Clohesyomyces aquaticus]
MAGETTPARCLYIIGPQCTGKTTLVNALEEKYCPSETTPSAQGLPSKPVVIQEVARSVLKEKQFSRHDITSSPSRALQLQKHILDAQFDAEKAAISLENPSSWYISDRSGLDPIIYARLFVGEEGAREMLASDKWEELERRMKAGVVMLCEAGSSWLVDDGTRLMPDGRKEWMRMDSAFREQLTARGICYTVVPKDLVSLEARVQLVHDCLSRM